MPTELDIFILQVERSFERLEFLGDAVLGLAARAYLFKHFPDATEVGGQVALQQFSPPRDRRIMRPLAHKIVQSAHPDDAQTQELLTLCS